MLLEQSHAAVHATSESCCCCCCVGAAGAAVAVLVIDSECGKRQKEGATRTRIPPQEDWAPILDGNRGVQVVAEPACLPGVLRLALMTRWHEACCMILTRLLKCNRDILKYNLKYQEDEIVKAPLFDQIKPRQMLT